MVCRLCATEKQPQDFYERNHVCKECYKKRVSDRRKDPEIGKKLREYDKHRYKNNKERRAATASYTKTKRNRYPEKYKAHNKLNNSLALGKIQKRPCEVCGSTKVEAHHDDYSKPLEVRWLCLVHHRQVHNAISEYILKEQEGKAIPK